MNRLSGRLLVLLHSIPAKPVFIVAIVGLIILLVISVYTGGGEPAP